MAIIDSPLLYAPHTKILRTKRARLSIFPIRSLFHGRGSVLSTVSTLKFARYVCRPKPPPYSKNLEITVQLIDCTVASPLKSLMLVYVTIPAIKRVSLEKIDSPAVLQEYTIREVTIKRFVPARMRD